MTTSRMQPDEALPAPEPLTTPIPVYPDAPVTFQRVGRGGRCALDDRSVEIWYQRGTSCAVGVRHHEPLWWGLALPHARAAAGILLRSGMALPLEQDVRIDMSDLVRHAVMARLWARQPLAWVWAKGAWWDAFWKTRVLAWMDGALAIHPSTSDNCWTVTVPGNGWALLHPRTLARARLASRNIQAEFATWTWSSAEELLRRHPDRYDQLKRLVGKQKV